MSGFAFWNPAKLLSYNATYNYVVGPRGNGKTYGLKRKVIKDALRKGRRFIYLRRYKPELAASARSFFTDIMHEFPDYKFRIHSQDGVKMAQASRVKLKDGETEKTRKWETLGYFLALSVSASYKSVSFADVDSIVYDEFITKNRTPGYIPDEFVAFNEFYSTVDRYNGRVRVFFVSNSVSVMNPYFIALDIQPDQIGKRLATFHTNPDTGKPFVAVELIHNETFQNQVFETDFGRFIAATDPEYAEYAVGNDFADGHNQLIEKKTAESEYLFTVETIRHGSFSVWQDFREGEFFIQTKLPKVQKVFTLDRNRMDEGKVFVKYNDGPLGRLRTAYNNARIKFDKPGTRNAFAEIMDKK